jgi:hypothetical protein
MTYMDDRRATATYDVRGAVMLGLAGLLLITLPMHWYTARSSYGFLEASGWTGLGIGRLVLLAVILTAGVFGVQALRGKLPLGGEDRIDGSHVLVVFAGLATAWLLIRLAAPPHFAVIKDRLFGFDGGTDSAATAQIEYGRTFAAFLAWATCAGVTVLAYLEAEDGGGFQLERAWLLLRRDRQIWRRMLPGVESARPAPIPPVPVRSSAIEAPGAVTVSARMEPEEAFCEACGSRLAASDRACSTCGNARAAV